MYDLPSRHVELSPTSVFLFPSCLLQRRASLAASTAFSSGTEGEGLISHFPKLKQPYGFPAENHILQKAPCCTEQLLPSSVLSLHRFSLLKMAIAWAERCISMCAHMLVWYSGMWGARVGRVLPFPKTLAGVVEVLHLPIHFWGTGSFHPTKCHVADGSICPCFCSHWNRH